MRAQGRGVVENRGRALFADAVIAGCDVQLYETRTSFQRYFDAHPNCPVRSLDDLVENKLIHSSIEADLAACAAEKAPLESAAYHEKLANIAALRRRLEAVLRQPLELCAFPISGCWFPRRAPKSARRNGCLTSMYGLPSIVVPAGSSRRGDATPGVPVGVEFIAGPGQEPACWRLTAPFELYQYRPCLLINFWESNIAFPFLDRKKLRTDRSASDLCV
jgi:Asp-tRNA(Asn)/Glu-tRNA(Gln) amidotransferase A subunit family amidase